MSDVATKVRVPIRLFAIVSVLACFGLGLITLYSSGIGLIDPKMHRAAGFALALIVAVVASENRLEEAKRGRPLALLINIILIIAGLWSIWSFYFVQNEMETALYDVTTADAWPALAGLVVFLELCRRLWGWGLFCVGVFGVFVVWARFARPSCPCRLFTKRGGRSTVVQHQQGRIWFNHKHRSQHGLHLHHIWCFA